MGIVPDPVCNTGQMLETYFGEHRDWPHQDLIGYTEQFQPAMALAEGVDHVGNHLSARQAGLAPPPGNPAAPGKTRRGR